MKRLTLFLVSAVLLVLFATSCKDQPSLTDPTDVIEPSMGKFNGLPDPNAERITLLIEALYPYGGQQNSALSRWRNIQRMVERGQLGAAESQMVTLSEEVLRMMERGDFDDYAADPGLPETAEGAVLELVTRLFVFVYLEVSDAIDQFPESIPEDFGVGVIDPDAEEPTVITTGNEWAAVVAPVGAVEESVVVTIALLDKDTCDEASPLTQALGCWEIKRYPEGDFVKDVTVEMCVADTDPPMDQSDWDLLLVHQKDEAEVITALPWVEPSDNIDCGDFTVDGGLDLVAGLTSSQSRLKALGQGLADLLLPEPLGASFMSFRRPPIGVGGLTGSFSEFFAAVPDYESSDEVAWGSVFHIRMPGGSPREFAFNAVKNPDGTVVGRYKWKYLNSANEGEGVITCMNTVGNRAWLGGRMTYSALSPGNVGRNQGFRVIDVAETEATDKYSLIYPLPWPAEQLPFDAAGYCAAMPEVPLDEDLATALSGSLTVVNSGPWAVCMEQSDIPVSECGALLDIYIDTGGPDWTLAPEDIPWFSNTEPCGWAGLVCNGSGLQAMDLVNRGLSGTIPAALERLSHLESLNLGRNDLSGSIPSELGNMASLEYLMLHYNELTGPVPPELANLTNLKILQFTFNQLSGPIPPELGSFPSLTSLNLLGNQLTGSIPPVLGNLSTLSGLALSSNDLTGPIPSELGNLSNLSFLGLDGNNLGPGIPASIFGLTNLSTLRLGVNPLGGTIPPAITNLTNLRSLALSSAGLSGTIPLDLDVLPDLEDLFLQGNALTGPIPPSLASLPKLTNVLLDNNQLTGTIPTGLGDLPDLFRLLLDHNQLSGSIPDDFANFTRLEHLGLSGNNFSGPLSLGVAQYLGRDEPQWWCRFLPQGGDVYLPYAQPYRKADEDLNGLICDLPLDAGNTHLAFSSNIGDGGEIYSVLLNGQRLTRLTNNARRDFEPDWTPDGESILLTRDDGPPNEHELHVIGADGSEQMNLSNHTAYDQDAKWSPDGSRIVFHSDRDGDFEIFLMDSDGGNISQVTDNPSRDREPAWSPDGSKVTYWSERDGNAEIYVYDISTGIETRLTTHAEADKNPAYSPDGTTIAFSSRRYEKWDIFVMPADGSSAPVQLTTDSHADSGPAWLADGDRILFTSDRNDDGNRELWIINSDGTGEMLASDLAGLSWWDPAIWH